MSETKTYTGGCHCGAVRFEAEINTGSAIACNCSICTKSGYILAFVPGSKFKLLSGKDALKDYQFNKKKIHHTFCTTCGVRPFGTGQTPDGGDMFAVNLRCVDELDLESVHPQKFDGKNM